MTATSPEGSTAGSEGCNRVHAVSWPMCAFGHLPLVLDWPLPFEAPSDAEFKLTDALHLRNFEVEGKRLTLVVSSNVIEAALYAVLPPNESAEQTVQWLREHPLRWRWALNDLSAMV